MKIRNVLWQLFGAIFAGIMVGVLIGYRTNIWIGILTGTLLACLMADWRHAWETGSTLAKEFASGIKRGLGVLKEAAEPSRFAYYGECAVRVFTVFCYAVLILGAFFIGCVTVSSLMELYVSKRGGGAFEDFLGSTVGFLAGCFLCIVCGYGITASVLSVVDKKSFTRFPILRAIDHWAGSLFPDKKEKTAPRWPERTIKEFFSLSWKDAAGHVLRWKRFGLLTILTAIVVGLPWITGVFALGAVISLILLILDAATTALLALATSRNTIAGYCAAGGIGLWFLLFPEFTGSALEVTRLICFAASGGLVGVGLYYAREKLLAIPVPKPETAGVPSA